VRDPHALCERNEKPSDAAADLEDLGGTLEHDAVEHDPLEVLLARGTKRLLAARVPGRNVELVILSGAPVPVAAHAGKEVVRQLLHLNSKIAFALALLASRHPFAATCRSMRAWTTGTASCRSISSSRC
jgi:hypothetical protein